MNDMVPHELPGNIFMQPWWLDIVAKDRWKDSVIENNGEVKARWPIVTNTRKGFKTIEMPVLTQQLGPWVKVQSKKKEGAYREERRLLRSIIDELPSFDFMVYKLNVNNRNYLPFKWSGFEQNSVTTFQIQHPFTMDGTWSNFKSSVRTDIRKAEELLIVDNNVSPKEVYELIKATYSKQGLSPNYSEELFIELCEAAVSKNRATLSGVFDKEKKIHSAQLFIHDDDTTYYLASGFDSSSKIAGAVSLGIWNGINLAFERNNTFDFEGSSIQPIENFFSAFGGDQVLFHQITKSSKKYAFINLIKEFLNLFKNTK